MPENCENSCPGLTRLEQQVDDIRRQNGTDHKEFRENIHKIERDEARQEGKLDSIVSALSDLKVDTKEISNKLTPMMNKMDDVDKLNKDVDELKAKPGKRWDGIAEKVIWAVCAAVIAFLMGRLGL